MSERGDDAARAVPRLVSALLAYFAVGSLGAQALGATAPGTSNELSSVVHAVGCAAFCVVGWLRPSSARWSLRGAVPAVGAYFVYLTAWAPLALFAYPWLMHTWGVEFAPQPQLAYFASPPTDGWRFYVVLASTVVLSPLAEELCFRGYLRDLLLSVMAPRAALLVNALLFGLIHGLPFALPLAALGLLFGWLRERHDGIGAPFVAHALHNGLTVALAVAWPELLGKIYGR